MDTSRVFEWWVALSVMMLIICTCVDADLYVSDQPVSEILAKYGLPIGLLPDSVKSYSLGDDGSFKVELDKPCYVQFNYLVYYEKTITGKLSYGKITGLDGIQAKQFFIWVDVTGIVMDLPSSDYIYFQVGIISKKIDISWFESVPTCKNSYGSEPCNEIEVAVAEERDVQ
uniref:TSA: Wollemia nobilis Ref_Wollemi_Transcript_8709_1002 transcribed RNA sequence n=1 Tax=Wollemia nobilis TaxID=56998 RepID=A0A0C9RNE3_9CONI